ncbi:uncharacterized protein LOC123704221 [Colias croceus]|uniref:uncharacterized protein LOC123704221 n=1 Tax=Colias crocea TaxID=72248 RepID=UPI001E27A063|nr:uncharacterized protein LOC123704221 [Colias croceus]CAG4963794.1 unnamed protein product [Colias eurytheme]
MVSRILFVALQAIVIQTAYSQCVNRVVNSCAPNVVETIVPNQYFNPQLPLLAPPAPILPACAPLAAAAPLMPGLIPEIGYPTVIQDSSVANSLANALQLLVVSNLLSSTLPGPCDLPGYPVESLMPLPAYNYVY